MKALKTNIIFALLVLLVGVLPSVAQTQLPEYIKTDLIISGGEYIVKHTTIASDATLYIDNETVLLFEEDAFVFVKGGLVIKGENNAFITARSVDMEKQGFGFVFSENSNTNISIDHTRFTHLKKPIQFEKNWLRAEVNISNSIFKNLNKNKVPIEIKGFDKLLTDKPLTVVIKGNTFSNNYSSILLTDIASEFVNFEIHKNVISQNLYFGADQNGIFTSPLFVNYNKWNNILKPSFKQNSFVYNFTTHLDDQDLEHYESFLYAIGSADRIDLANNYLGAQSDLDLGEILSQIQAEHEAPIINIKGRLGAPGKSLNGHVYSIAVNDNPEPSSPFTIAVNEDLLRLTLTANRPIQASKYYSVQYRYMLDDSINIVQLDHKLSYSDVYHTIIVDLEDRELKKHLNGYIVIDGFYDIDGFDVPAVSIGLYQFLKENRDYIMYFENLEQIPKKFLTKFEPPFTDKVRLDTSAIIDAQQKPTGKKSEVPYPYKWDAGVFVGSTIYFGDLATTGVQIYLPNARPNLGFRLGYRPTSHWRIELAQNTMVLTGNDRRETTVGKSRGTNYKRGLSFRTTVIDLGLNVEYQILRFRTVSSLVPSIFVGISGYYYKPEGEYNDTYYDLREIGSEGQTQDGGSTYSEFSYAVPFGIKLSKHLNKRNLLCLSYTYNKLYTDYLDDVSTGEFQTSEALDDVNLRVGKIAYELSNPSGLTGQRSYSDSYDGFAYWGITWLHRF
jgi:hypothetical protein